MELQAVEALTRIEDRENDLMKPLEVPNYPETCSIILLVRHNASLCSHWFYWYIPTHQVRVTDMVQGGGGNALKVRH